MVTQPSGQTWLGPQNPAWEDAVPVRPVGQTALSTAQNMQEFGAPNGRVEAPNFCPFQAAERA
eukprot:12482269-Alexandrium_andersonii.AAC.1